MELLLARSRGNAGVRALEVNEAGELCVALDASGGAMTAADGADVALGAIADAAVDGDAAGTVNAHLRGISKKLAASVAVTGTVTADTELPAAAALNGTILKSVSAPVVGAALLVSDNTNLIQPLGDAANGLDVDVTRLPALVAGEAHVGEVGGRTVTVTGTVTRPALDTNQYTAGDVVCNSTSAPAVIAFSGCARANGGTGMIVGAHCVDSANQTTKPQLELWLFDTTITPDNDNAVFTPTDAELLTLVGIIQFATWYVGDATAAAGGNCASLATLVNHIAFDCGAAVTALYGVLVARNAYTPVADEVFSIRLRVLQD